MREKLEEISKKSREKIKEIKNSQELNDLKVKVLGKKGELTEILRGMGQIAAEERPVIGSLANKVRNEVENMISEKEAEFKKQELQKELEDETIDITLPATKVKRGMQDSFYITTEYLLRTQTSSVQARTMMANEEKTPIRIICPGKTYRKEDDATHSHQFNQVEGLVVDKNISFADLKGTLEIFMRKLLGENTQLRFRPSYFPFTEPSYEVDVSCFKCSGKGCNLCKQTGWIEVLGSGIVHPNVLKMNGYDPDVYSGFAFGTGLDRLAMFKYGITDMRLLYTNDVKFLSQFDRKD